MQPNVSCSGSSANFMSVAQAQGAGHFRHDGNGNFGSALGADGQADWPVNPGNQPRRKIPSSASARRGLPGFSWSPGRRYKNIRTSGGGKGRIINLGIMGQRQKRRARVKRRDLAIPRRAMGVSAMPGNRAPCRKGPAGINHRDIIARLPAIGITLCAICTAPMITNRKGGLWTCTNSPP